MSLEGVNNLLIRGLVLVLIGMSIPVCNAQAAAPPAVRSRHAMVVCADQYAAEEGIRVLRRGGNAVDAAVAMGFILAVTYPEAGNIGGGGYMLIRKYDGTACVVDFREKAPKAATRTMYTYGAGPMTDKSVNGHLSVAVPGTVAGFKKALDNLGTMKWSDLIRPAVDLAEKGIVVTEHNAHSFEEYDRELHLYPSTVKVFAKSGALPHEGDTLRQPDLAATLRRVQNGGADEFYRGETARLILGEMRRGGGLITEDDLKNYSAIVCKPLEASYRGYTILAVPPSSSGGICLLELLNIVEGYDLKSMGFHSSRAVHVMTEAMKRVYVDRAEFMGDPKFVDVPTDALVSKNYADERRKGIDTARAGSGKSVRHGDVQDRPGKHTTHYAVIDDSGTVVTTTYTLNDSYGSKVVVDGAGFFLNDEMDDFSVMPGVPNLYGLVGGDANSIEPEKRPLSSMSPAIVLKNDKPVMVLGARGGSKIITAVFQTIVNVIDFGMSAQEAVDAPRFHHQWSPDTLLYERFCFPEDVIHNLQNMGHSLKEIGYSLGQIEVISRDLEKGWIYGAPDPREGGTAVGY